MRTIILVFSLLLSFFSVACSQNNSTSSIDSDLKSLKLVNIDFAGKKAFYVPAKVVLRGARSDQKPVSVMVGSKRLIQGMVSLADDKNERQILEKRVKEKYGNDFSLQKNLAGTFKIAMKVEDKEIFTHEVFSANINLPFQMNVGQASTSVKVSLTYSGQVGGRKKQHQTSISRTQTYGRFNNASGTTAQASASAQIKNSSTDEKIFSIDEFSLEQEFEF